MRHSPPVTGLRSRCRFHLRCFLRRAAGVRRSVGVPAAVALMAVAAATATHRLGAQVWSPIGPNGGPLGAIAQAPGAPQVMYAVASGGGIFRSGNHGRDWQLAGDALDRQFLEDLVVDPTDPSVLYASVVGAGVERSTDAGTSWRPLGTGLPGPVPFVMVLAIDPSDHRTLYAGTLNGPYKSTDGGASWTPPTGAITQQQVYALLVDPAHPSTIYAGCNGGGFFKSSDGGASWAAKNAGFLPDTVVIDLAADPGSPGTLYATAGSQIYRSDDGGESWTAGDAGVFIDHLVVAPNGWLFGLSVNDVSRSTDRGATWVSTAIGSPPTTEHRRGLIADAETPGLIFAATTSGLLASPSYGAVWLPSSRGLAATSVAKVAIAAGSPATVYASVDGMGVVRSQVAGPGAAGHTAWQPANGELTVEQLDAFTALAVNPRHPTDLWRGTFFGAAHSSDGGATWTVADIPDDCMVVQAIVVDPTRSATVYVAATEYENSCARRDSNSWKTTDGGATWQSLPIDSANLLIDPTHPAILYLFFDTGVFRSDDAGSSWQQTSLRSGGSPVNDLAIDPTRTATLYAATGDGVFKTTDRGNTWRRASGGLPPGSVVGIAIDPRHPSHVYAAIAATATSPAAVTGGAANGAGAAGVFLSVDGAASWSPYGAGLPAPELSGLLFDRADPGHLYALTQGYGLYRIGAAPPTP